MADACAQSPAFEVHALVADGAFVVAVGEITSCDADGAPVRQAYADAWRFRDGRMAGLQAFVV